MTTSFPGDFEEYDLSDTETESKTFLCFIVNVHTSLDFDIDFMTPIDPKILKEVLRSEYQYLDLPDDLSLNGNLREETGVSYRVRLSGVKKLRVDDEQYHQLISKSRIEVLRFFDLNDGYAIIELDHVDKYGRLLAQIRDPVTKVNLGDRLITQFPMLFGHYLHN